MKPTHTSPTMLLRCSQWVAQTGALLFVVTASIGGGLLLSPFMGNAQATGCTPGSGALGALACAGSTSYGPQAQNVTIIAIVGNAIGVFLGVLGILFTLLLIYAGFLWMTARGDTKQVDKAQPMIQQAVIGMVITLSAWVVGYFVVNALVSIVTSSR